MDETIFELLVDCTIALGETADIITHASIEDIRKERPKLRRLANKVDKLVTEHSNEILKKQKVRDACVSEAAKMYRVKKGAILSDSQNIADSKARRVAIYFAHTFFSVPQEDCVTMFNRSITSVADAIYRVEDEREDVNFDEALTEIEERLIAIRDVG